jgi:hypothetical protein
MGNAERISWLAIAPSPPAVFLKSGAGAHRRLPITQVARAIKPYGFVYVFAAQSLVKIGMTRYSIYRRWHSIKTANPWLERPLYVSPALFGRVIELERACHRALSAYHVTGEWFECDRALAIETVRRIIGAP